MCTLQTQPTKMSDDRDYLVKHSIPQVINDLVTALVKDKPAHAVPYMTEWFTNKAVVFHPFFSWWVTELKVQSTSAGLSTY